MNNKKLIIIDGHSLLYRAFYALPPLAKNGQQTGAVYGFLLMFFRALKDIKADYALVCFDAGGPTFRHNRFADYKSHRPATPESLVNQIVLAKKIAEVLGLPIFEKNGFEADDLIATIVHKTKSQCQVYILSGDLDNLQLVEDSVFVYTLNKGIKEAIIYDKQKVRERFGVNPSQMNDFKALVGDNSDNIPGVPGVGKNTAADIIRNYGNIKNLYDELATDTAVLKPKIKETLKINKEKAFLSLELVKTCPNVSLEFSLEKCKLGNFNRQTAQKLFEELGFFSLINKLSELF